MGEQGDVDVVDVVAADVIGHLPDGLQEGQALDVAHGAAHLDDHDVKIRLVGEPHHLLLYDVCNVRHSLDGAPQVVAGPLVGDDAAVHLPGGHAGGAGQLQVDETLIVAQVHVGLGPVARDEDLAVLVRGHGAGVDVKVGVELLNGDGEAGALEDSRNRCGADAFPDGTHHAASHKDVFRHTGQPLSPGL